MPWSATPGVLQLVLPTPLHWMELELFRNGRWSMRRASHWMKIGDNPMQFSPVAMVKMLLHSFSAMKNPRHLPTSVVRNMLKVGQGNSLEVATDVAMSEDMGCRQVLGYSERSSVHTQVNILMPLHLTTSHTSPRKCRPLAL